MRMVDEVNKNQPIEEHPTEEHLTEEHLTEERPMDESPIGGYYPGEAADEKKAEAEEDAAEEKDEPTLKEKIRDLVGEIGDEIQELADQVGAHILRPLHEDLMAIVKRLKARIEHEKAIAKKLETQKDTRTDEERKSR